MHAHVDFQLSPATPPLPPPAPTHPYALQGIIHVTQVLNFGAKPMQGLLVTAMRHVTIHNMYTGTCLLYTPAPDATVGNGRVAGAAPGCPGAPPPPADDSDVGPRMVHVMLRQLAGSDVSSDPAVMGRGADVSGESGSGSISTGRVPHPGGGGVSDRVPDADVSRLASYSPAESAARHVLTHPPLCQRSVFALVGTTL